MNKNILTTLFIFSCSAYAQTNSPRGAKTIITVKYPPIKAVEVADDYFGTKVADPYRWLEDDNSPETVKWVEDENKVTEGYLKKIPFREAVKKRLTEIWNYPKATAPFKGGNNYFVHTNDGLQNQYVLNIVRDMTGDPVQFLDVNTLSSDGTVSVNEVSASHDGKNLAYTVSKAGSDWNEIHVMDVATGKSWHDNLQWVKFSGIAWRGKAFYYSRYDAPADSADILKGKNEFHKVYYHAVGYPQARDPLVFADKAHPQRNFGAAITDDERYLIIRGSEGTSGNNLILQDLVAGRGRWIVLVNDFTNNYHVVDNDSSVLYILTNKDAPKYKLVAFDLSQPDKGFYDVIPEGESVMQQVSLAKYNFVVKSMVDASSRLKVFSRKGTFLYDIPLESIGSVDELNTSNKDENIFYSLTTFTSPPIVYQFNVTTREQKVYFKPKINFNSNDYVTEQIFYKSKDSTRIPMFLVHKKGMLKNGNNPTLLFGYGGFNISKTPEFKVERLVFLEQGGVFAMPAIRGGGEYGEEWHSAGTKERKQNVFDDFIAAAEFLISEKYTNPQKLAIGGRSNGGLLVGAVMTQRPDLFKVAIPTVGVMDMLRYHKFTIGWAWKSDYGSSETKEGFDYLYKYSPLHNIKSGVKYPATMATTGDHDDRVVPAHSFKFISMLQKNQAGMNPILIRIDINAGHAGSTSLGSSKPVAKQIEEQTDIVSFMMYNLGMKME